MTDLTDEQIDALLTHMARRRIRYVGGWGVITWGPHPEPARLNVERGCLMIRAFGWQLHAWTERGAL